MLTREDKSETWLATLTGVSAPTINRLNQHRISPESLRALCTRTPAPYALEILIAHLRDEIERAGRLQSEGQIEAANVRADDLTLLAIEAQSNPDLRDMLHDLANLVRRYQRHQTETELMVAEPQAPYGKKTTSALGDLARAKAAKGSAPAPAPTPPAAP